MKIKKLTVSILLLIVFTGFLFNDDIYSYLVENFLFIQSFYEKDPEMFIIYFVFAYLFMTTLSLPVALVMGLLAGSILDIYSAVILVSFTSSIGATIAMSLSRYILRDYMSSRYRKYFDIINSNFRGSGGYYLFALRMSPLFPFFIINICFGLTNMKLALFYLISQIGMLPGTIIIILMGNELGNILITGDVMSPSLVIYLTLLGLIPLLSKKFLKT
jgi:uncharacterized membrane protein YdjX (TVP38/TMEM64 family)